MTLHLLRSAAPPELGLEEFERQFSYPLGEGARFHVSHGADYLPFFAAMGDATVLVAEDQGRVLATLAAVLRPLQCPDGRVRTVAYLGDLKVAPGAPPTTLLGMFRAMREVLAGAEGGYGVVMDGTGRTPADYTGRLRIPAFVPVAKLLVLSISTQAGGVGEEIVLPEPDRLHPGYRPLGGNPSLRSEMRPIPLGTDGASGLLEDTRRGKRLHRTTGEEMRAAHLSRFAWKTPADGARLLRQASARCAAAGIPTLFVCACSDVLAELGDLRVQPAPATVYASGLEAGAWSVDSAEI